VQLFYSPTSIFARKALVLLRESGHLDEIELMGASGTPVNPGTMPTAHNPLGKIPVLVRDDGAALFDSRVICRFLDAHFAAGLYPSPPRLWDTLTLEALADGIADAAILMVYETRLRAPEQVLQSWIDGQWSKVERALDVLESDRSDHLKGPLDMGHVAVGCALSYLDFRHGARAWRENRPRLAAWENDFAAREHMRATVPTE